MRISGCVHSDRSFWLVWPVKTGALTGCFALLFAQTGGLTLPSVHAAEPPASPADYSQCAALDGEKAFFASLKKQSRFEAATALAPENRAPNPCASDPNHARAFTEGFDQAFTARRYFPTFGRFGVHPVIKRSELSYACTEFDASSAARACCIGGYSAGEAAFKKALKKAPLSPQCSSDFANGVRDGEKQCELLRKQSPACFLPKKFQCQAICYSFGWNESLAPCLVQTASWSDPAEGGSNRTIRFLPGYAPAPEGTPRSSQESSPSQSESAR